MKRKLNFLITVVLLHTYLAVGIAMAVLHIKVHKRTFKKIPDLKVGKPQPSVE